MKKLILQAVILVLLFFGMYFSFTKIDWMTLFNVEQISNNTEQKLGDLFWELIKKSEREIKDPEIVDAIDSLLTKICESNGVDREKIQLHIIEKNDVNAFALPNQRLVIYSGLILNAENEAALCGVIGHELAHIELNHVMKKLVKEIGLSVLIGMTAGNGGGEAVRGAVKILTSSAYDRNLETEADLKAVEYLNASGLSAEPFAEFLYHMDAHAEMPGFLTWISTHPDSKERAEYILESGSGIVTESIPVLKGDTWNLLKNKLEESYND